MRCWWLVFCGFLLAAGAMGHHGPEEVVAELTAKLAERPDDADLLGRRATEYRVLGKLAEAEADLERVLALHPESAEATEALARVQWAQGKQVLAISTGRKAVGLARPGRDRGAVLILLAEWYLWRSAHVRAMDSCEKAFEEDPKGMVDWYLLRSRIQEKVGGAGTGVEGLKSGYKTLESVVLRDAWVDASLDAKQFAAVAPVIEKELGQARLQSSWLLRRGRLRIGMGEVEAGKADLKAATAELDRRIHPERPDAKLLVDRGWARWLLGDAEEARKDLVLARKFGADPWEVERLEHRIHQAMLPALPG